MFFIGCFEPKAMLGRDGRAVRILLVLLLVAAVVIGLAVGVYEEFGSVGLTGLSVVVSGILTAALVVLYFHQTSILDAQRELLTQELQREARQQHTETLRTRVEQ
jgi:membrane associated rhomboid family serine protease